MITASLTEPLEELLGHLGIQSSLVEVVVAALILLAPVAAGIGVLVKVVKTFVAWSTVSKGDGRRQLRRRSAFARFVEGRIRDLDNKEEWSDHRFAELEAEVETEGVRKRRGMLRLRRHGLRRERSLSRAMMNSRDPLILLQGDPGSGKSVALRHVARKLADKAVRARRLDTVIPLYINLKGLHRNGRPIDANLIEDYVLNSLREGANADVERYLDAEFDEGKVDGTWLFLFDSFDEIPELLNSTEAESAVAEYSEAISKFNGISNCRAVIASRHFRAPPKYGLPSFTIVPLSDRRRRELIRKADLEPKELHLLASLPAADVELVALSANPLFLGLLIEYVRERQVLPTGWYDVFEDFITRRLEGHAARLEQSFGLTASTLREISEQIAFTMTATPELGLNPRRSDLKDAYLAQGFARSEHLSAAMDALQWTKLARSEEGEMSSVDPTFTFAQRRFQEYFATNVVLREPNRVRPIQLLTEASWRETAVTLCQSKDIDATPLLDEAEQLLKNAVADAVSTVESGSAFSWPPGALHVLGVLQSGFAGRSDRLSTPLRNNVRILLDAAVEDGTITDHKWALEVAGTVPTDELADLLLSAFDGRSNWLREVAYRQAGRLSSIPDELGEEIRRALLRLMVMGKFFVDWPPTRAQVMRLRPRTNFVAAARILRFIPIFDAAVCLTGAIILSIVTSIVWCPAFLLVAVLLHLSLYPVLAIVSGGNPLGHGRRSRHRRPPFRLWRPFGLLSTGAALEMRAVGFIAPIAVAAGRGDPILIAVAALFTYAFLWGPSAAALAITSPRQRFAGWCAAPLTFLPPLVRAVKPPSLRLIGVAAATGIVLAALLFGLVRAPHLVDYAFIGVSAGISLLGIIFVAWQITVERVKDYVWFRQWRRRHTRSISAQEFMEMLTVVRRPTVVGRCIREVRAKRMMEGDPESKEVLRGLLRLIAAAAEQDDELEENERQDEQGDEAPPTAIPIGLPEVVEVWLGDDPVGNQLKILRLDIEDALGQLLEEIDSDKELPVA